MNILDSGLMKRQMVKENIRWEIMGLFMKVIGITIYKKAMGQKNGQMVLILLGNMLLARNKDMVCTHGEMDQSIREIGIKIR